MTMKNQNNDNVLETENTQQSNTITKDNDNTPPEELPAFEIRVRTYRHAHTLTATTTSTTVITLVLEIRCEAKYATLMRSIIIQASLSRKKYGLFIPSNMRTYDAELYHRHLRQHSHYLSNLQVIPVHGLSQPKLEQLINKPENGEEIMLMDYLLEINDDNENKPQNLFLAIEPTMNSTNTGRWLFLTTKQQSKKAEYFIDTHLTNLLQKGELMETMETSIEGIENVRRVNKPSEETITYASILRANLQDTNLSTQSSKSVPTTNTKRRPQLNILYKHKKDKAQQNTKNTTTNTSEKKTTKTPTNQENALSEEREVTEAVEEAITTNDNTDSTPKVTVEEFEKLKNQVQQQTTQIEQLIKQNSEQRQLYQNIQNSIQDIQRNILKLAETSLRNQPFTTSMATQPIESDNQAEKRPSIGNSLPPSKKPAYHARLANTCMETVEEDEDEDLEDQNYPNEYSSHHPPRLKDPPQI